MPQFLIDRLGVIGQNFLLPPQEAHHLRDVLRMKEGDRLHLADPEGDRFEGTITTISKSEVHVLIGRKLPTQTSGGILRLGQAILKKERMELVLQKSVELGVESLHPFSSSRTIAKLDKPEKLKRWQKIADEAAKQCGRGKMMTIEPPMAFNELVKRSDADLKIIFWEEGGEPLKDFFCRGAIQYARPLEVFAIIGPEGGFPKEEVDRAREAGFHVLSLGPRVLRAETAAITAISLIQYELGNI